MGNQAAPVETIVTTVAEYEDVSPRDLPPLREWIAPETLARLTTDRCDRTDSLELSYIWYRVTVHPDGDITVTQPGMAD